MSGKNRLWVTEVRDYEGGWWPLQDSVRESRASGIARTHEWRERDADPDTAYRTVQYERVEPPKRKKAGR